MSNPNYPYSPGRFSDDMNPYSSTAPVGPQPSRGMVGHIRIMAILQIVTGVMELMMAGMMLVTGVVLQTQRDSFIEGFQKNNKGNADPEMAHFVFITVMLSMGAIALALALLRIVSGIMNFQLRGRMLGVVACIVGLLTCFTVYCAPFSLGMAIYGLIVLLNCEVREAFEMRAQGQSANEVFFAFESRPR